MGAYLSEPITEKISTDEVSDRLSCGSSSMQGWRVNQEDAHNCLLDFDKDTSLFAVYDGHGGHEVALYVSQHLPNFLKNLESYKANDLEKALIDAFIDFDATLCTPEIVAILKELAGPKDKEDGATNVDGGGGNSSDEENENVNDLYEEASMPLEQVMEKYQNQQVNKLSNESEKSPSSPYLRAKQGSSKSDSQAGSSGEGGSGLSKVENKDEEKTKDEAGEKPIVEEEKGDVIEEKTNGKSESSPVKASESGDLKDSDEKEQLIKQNGEVVQNGEHPTKEVVENSPSKKGKSKAISPYKKCSSRIKSLKEKLNLGKQDIQKIYSAILSANCDDDDSDESDEEHDDTFDADGEVENSSEEEGDVDGEEELSDDDDVESEEDEDEDDDCQMNMIEEPGFDSGCTAVVALLRGNQLYVANAGDSRCVVSRAGKVVEMSFDHKPENDEELARITKAGGKVTPDGRVNGGLNLSRALGDHAYKQKKELSAREQMITALPDISQLTLKPEEDEFMVLACDGIWNFMSNEEVVEFVGSRLKDGQRKISEICEEMFDHCLAPNTIGDGTGCDNMTAIIVQFKRDGDSKGDNISVVSGGAKRTASPVPTTEEPTSNKRPKLDETESTKATTEEPSSTSELTAKQL